MRPIDLQDRHLPLHRNYLIEASAGTGKTFSIETIVVRLLLEEEKGGPPPSLEQILIVTFTRAATSDLKGRIRKRLEKTKEVLEERSSDAPDFLQQIIEQGADSVAQAVRRINHALSLYERAPIYTIHSFCYQMLTRFPFEANVKIDKNAQETTVSSIKLLEWIRDTFRTEITEEQFPAVQLKILLQAQRGDMDTLAHALLPFVRSTLPVHDYPDYQTYYTRFVQAMQTLTQKFSDPEAILQDFLLQAPCYKKPAETTEKAIARVTRFAKLFGQTSWSKEEFATLVEEKIYLVQALDENNRRVRAPTIDPSELRYPTLVRALQNILLPIVEGASSSSELFARLAKKCQERVEKNLREEELFRFDDLLKVMQESAKSPTFRNEVQKTFRAALVDEFQDTDPLQWHLFKTLFLSAVPLYLVGDPKQSIYAFRQADIYAYLEAAEALGESQRRSLTTNYRAGPPLIYALNTLFSSCSQLFPLPKTGTHLPFHEVQPAPEATAWEPTDQTGAVHMPLVEIKKQTAWETIETNYLFPFIAQEILRLHKKENIPLEENAILVADRYQGRRLLSYLKKWNLPATLARQETLIDTPAFNTLEELLEGILYFSNEAKRNTALGGKLLSLPDTQIQELSDPEKAESLLSVLADLRTCLVEKGITPFFANVQRLRWKKMGPTLLEILFSEEGGKQLFHDCEQLVALLAEHEQETKATPEQLLLYLQELRHSEAPEEQAASRLPEQGEPSITIQTIHASKGLEFGIVFSVGLTKRTPLPSSLIPFEEEWIAPHPSAPTTTSYLLESDAEKMRQLYVAFTRAKKRLYAPLVLFPKTPRQGTSAPMELFAKKLTGEETLSIKGIENWFHKQNDPVLTTAPLKTSPSILPLHPVSQSAPTPLIAPPELSFHFSTQFLTSFTQLTKTETVPHGTNSPYDFTVPKKTTHTLPAGSETGLLLHLLLEKIPLSLLCNAQTKQELIPLITPFTQNTPFAPWDSVLATLLLDTFRTPLPTTGASFCLSQIDPEETFREMEFLYPSKDNNLLKGVIDLIFAYKNRYYLLDWKSNWLGPEPSDYGPEKIEEAMRQHSYHLQATLYQEALKRYLAIVDKRPFSECFGGTYYIFLRGTPKKGAYFLKPCTE